MIYNKNMTFHNNDHSWEEEEGGEGGGGFKRKVLRVLC